MPARGSLLGIEHLDTKEILGLLKLARRINPQKPRPLLRGKRIVLLFYEPSTRTRTSFELRRSRWARSRRWCSLRGQASRKASPCSIRIHLASGGCGLHRNASSVGRRAAPDGETSRHSRHQCRGRDAEHPSQALLDAFTILKHKKSFKGCKRRLSETFFTAGSPAVHVTC